MTRRREMMLEDLFGCDHEPELAVSEGGQILYWRCRCGERTCKPAEQTPPTQRESEE